MLFPPFEGAELGRWYRIEMNGAQSPKITGRIADIFETRPAASGSAKNGPYQVCFLKLSTHQKYTNLKEFFRF